MKAKTISHKDLLEIEDVQDDPRTIVIDEIKKHGFTSRKILHHNHKISYGIIDSVVRDLMNEKIIISKKQFVKFKGKKEYESLRCYVFTS